MTFTHTSLLEILSYNPDSGVFRWVATDRSCCHSPCGIGYLHKGYRYIAIYNKRYSAHRLAWFYIHGQWPHAEIDHVNGNRDDNRLSNLRAASRLENARNRGIQTNNTSGYIGVHFDKTKSRWRAQIKANGKRIHLGWFNSPSDASEAYRRACPVYFGDFYRAAPFRTARTANLHVDEERGNRSSGASQTEVPVNRITGASSNADGRGVTERAAVRTL